jgi:hypothetical protein
MCCEFLSTFLVRQDCLSGSTVMLPDKHGCAWCLGARGLVQRMLQRSQLMPAGAAVDMHGGTVYARAAGMAPCMHSSVRKCPWLCTQQRFSLFEHRALLCAMLQPLAPFTNEEAPELLAVSFYNNFLNRVTIAQLATNETLPVTGFLRPLLQRCSALQAGLFRTLMKPVIPDEVLAGKAADTRPHSNHPLQPSFKWVADLLPVSAAVAYFDVVVNCQLRGRFLPLDLWCAS